MSSDSVATICSFSYRDAHLLSVLISLRGFTSTDGIKCCGMTACESLYMKSIFPPHIEMFWWIHSFSPGIAWDFRLSCGPYTTNQLMIIISHYYQLTIISCSKKHYNPIGSTEYTIFIEGTADLKNGPGAPVYWRSFFIFSVGLSVVIVNHIMPTASI
jgi:hypothetical protein